MASLTAALRRVKDDLKSHLDESLIHALCQEAGHTWRDRTLGPVVTLWLFVEQVLAGNVACVALRHLVRRVMLQAAGQQNVSPDRVSFIDALRWLRHAAPGDVLPPLIVNALRPDRFEPRALKRRKQGYPVMTQPRSQPRQALVDSGDKR